MAGPCGLLGLSFQARINNETEIANAIMQGTPIEINKVTPLLGTRPQIPEGKSPIQ